MQLLIFIAVCAGLTYGQTEYSDCDTTMAIITECSQKYMEKYLKPINAVTYAQMKEISKLDDILELVKYVNLVEVCNKTEKLNMYYTCVFTNLTNCIGNQSQADLMPNPTSIAKGIVNVCNKLSDLNTTCVKGHMDDVETCVSKSTKDASTCDVNKGEYMCMDKLDSCKGAGIMRDFIKSARPNICGEISAATQILTAFFLLLFATLSSILMNL